MQLYVAVTWGSQTRDSGEQCDDGNMLAGDGCSDACTIEAGFQCLGGSTTTIDVWSDACGDGKVYKRTAKFWDDGTEVYTKIDP